MGCYQTVRNRSVRSRNSISLLISLWGRNVLNKTIEVRRLIEGRGKSMAIGEVSMGY